MFWTVASFPRCTHHIFLSHCAEDRKALTYPVYQALWQRGIVSWLDRHDYPYGRNSRSALRDSILHSRHTAFLITDAMLSSPRGWCVQELAWSELLQDNFHYSGGDLVNLILPLYFVEQSDNRLPRSVWQALRDRGSSGQEVLIRSNGQPPRSSYFCAEKRNMRTICLKLQA